MINKLYSESLLFVHKGVELPITVNFYFSKEEPQEDFYPGSPEEFEISSIIIDDFYYGRDKKIESFNFHDVMNEEFGECVNVSDFCEWVDGLEESAVKAFYKHIEKKKENKDD